MKKRNYLKIIVICIATVFVVHQLYASLYSPIKTEVAEYIETVDGINVTGLLIRNETVITQTASGVLYFNISDGERVAKDGVIADVYSKSEDALAIKRIDEINQKIQNIETIQSYNATSAIDLQILNQKINSSVYALSKSAAKENYYDNYEVSASLLTDLNRKQMVTGGQYDFSVQLNALSSEKSSIEASLQKPFSSVYSPSSGFFVSTTDGYEDVFTTDDLSVYTPEFLSSAKSSEKKEAVGKIVSDYKWYIACTLSFDNSLLFKKGDTAKIKTPLKLSPELNVKVEQVNSSISEEDAVVIFSCSEMNSELASMRSSAMVLVKGEYKGLKVNKTALRVVEDVTGVYVSTGTELKFIPVTVLYSDDDYNYCICERKLDTDKGTLRLYDKIVVKGKNLYDGKLIA